MIKLFDWNFLLSIITLSVAIIALWQTAYQTKLSNKQQLFERRLNTYLVIKSLLDVYSEHHSVLQTCKSDEPLFALDTVFCFMTNSAVLQDMANAMGNPLHQPEHREFLAKCEELRKISTEISLIYTGKVAEVFSIFVAHYENMLRTMYRYQVLMKSIQDKNNVLTYEQLKNNMGENNLRTEVINGIQDIEGIYVQIGDKKIENELRKQIKLK